MPKQAVVLIHGIGEQVPMDTLRGFVRAVWTDDAALRDPGVPSQVWSKPDNVSRNYELRRLTTAETKNDKRTDFFEFYWADLMEGTEVEHVQAWLKLLLFRSPGRVPRQLRGIWWTVVILLLIAVGFVIAGLVTPLPAWIGWLVGICTTTLSGFLLWPIKKVVGDAARYLHVAPPNIGKRRIIREAGIRLLRRLHTCGDYDRIILVGHSLGTVVGYDILTHLWPRYNTSHTGEVSAVPDALETLSAKTGLTAGEYQLAQSDYAAALKSAGSRWLVTDFITMGSPLAHASFLLTRKPEEFQTKKIERELPTCPPTLESVEGQPRFHYPLRKAWFPNHAAVFAATRWTNIYFPCSWTLKGDVIGGPMRPVFGPGILDVPVTTDINYGLLNHTHYWESPKNAAGIPAHIAALRSALKLL